MLSFDPALLAALAHPCIGALIGYLSANISLRLLFRPLQPWHLFGVRVPMTPGALVARRHALAVNFGAMVGRHLLTGREIAAALAAESFQRHLTATVDRRVREVFRLELGPLPTIIPDRFRAYVQVGIKTLKYRLAEGVNGYLASDIFTEKLTATLVNRLEELADQEVQALLDRDSRHAVYLFIEEVLSELLESEQTEVWCADALLAGLQQTAAQGFPLGALVPEGLAQVVREALPDFSDLLLRQLTERLADPAGSLFADEERAAAAWLEHPEFRERLTAVLAQSIEEGLNRPLTDGLARLGREGQEALCRGVARRLLQAMRTEGAMTGLRVLIHFGLETLVADGRRPLTDLVERFVPGESSRELRLAVAQGCVTLLRAGINGRLVSGILGTMVDALLARPLGPLYDLIPHGVREGLSDSLMLAANRLLLQEVPGVVESLHLERMVTQKIDSLDQHRLERMLLPDMQAKFRGIHLVGALIGFLLGLGNLAVSLLE